MTEGKGPVNICANHVLEEDGDDDEDDDEEIEEDEEMAEVEAEVSHLSISQTQSPRNPENTNFQNRTRFGIFAFLGFMCEGSPDPSHFYLRNQCRKEADPTWNDSGFE